MIGTSKVTGTTGVPEAAWTPQTTRIFQVARPDRGPSPKAAGYSYLLLRQGYPLDDRDFQSSRAQQGHEAAGTILGAPRLTR